MAKIVRLTEQDLVRLVNRILKEDVKMEVEPSKDNSNEGYMERELKDGGFMPVMKPDKLNNHISIRPNLTGAIWCRVDRFRSCNYDNGYQVEITFNRKVKELEGYWSNKQAPGPLVELSKVMDERYDFNNKGTTEMVAYGLSSDKARDILRLYNKIKYK